MMISALRWKINKPITVFTLLFLPLLLSLGAWQLRRADEKRLVQTAFAAQLAAAPVELSQLPARPPQYARVHLRGRYDNARSFLLDNRILHGRFGYEVLTTFIPVGSANVVLVNRGWIEGDPARLSRPIIAPVEGEVSITASVYRDTARFHFVDNAREAAWPKLIQQLRFEDLQQQLGSPMFPFVLRLEAGMPGAYQIEWQVVPAGFGPDKHLAYATTWFALTLALVVLWFASNTNITQLLTRNSDAN